MYICVTKSKVYTAHSLVSLNKKMKAQLDYDEFHSVGPDQLVILNEDNLDFVQDKRKLSSIMFGNFFKKDMMTRNMLIANLVLDVIILMQVINISNVCSKILAAVNV